MHTQCLLQRVNQTLCTVGGLFALLAGLLGAGPAGATVLIGPDLSDIAVLSDGTLEIQGLGGVARSSDGGKTWQVIQATRRLGPPFWKRIFKGPDGAMYQNIVMNGTMSIIIRSRDDGVTWEHAEFADAQALMVWADERGVFYFNARDLRVLESEHGINWIGSGTLHGRHGRHAFADYDHDFLAVDFDGPRIGRAFFEGSSGQPIMLHDIGDTVITGFVLDRDGTIFLTTRSQLYKGMDYGHFWTELGYPPGWQSSTGPVPFGSPVLSPPPPSAPPRTPPGS